jgi:hypothetical protein
MTKYGKKLCFVVSSNVHVRNYLTSNALNNIAQNYECIFLISDTVSVSRKFKDRHIVKTFKATSSKEHRFLFDLMMFSLSKMSSTFCFRIKRFYFPKPDFKRNGKHSFSSRVYFLLKSVYLVGVWLWMVTLTLPIIRRVTIPLAKLRLKPNKHLRRLVEEYNPDLIIAPSSSYDPDNMDILLWAKDKTNQTMFIIDNWDNLSSKSVLFERPDFMSVWGEQSIEHAVNIHQMKREQVFTLGTPRFDQYFQMRNKKLKSPFPHPYFLFVGTAVAFDERAALEELNNVIKCHENFKNHFIIYRPHPWRQSNDVFSVEDLEHVKIDPQILAAFQSGNKTQQPNLDYYPALLQNAKCCLGGMTTMLIESLIMKTPFLALTWDDKNFITNMKDVRHQYMHFNKIEQISSLYFNNHPHKLFEDLIKTCADKTVSDTDILDAELNYFYTIHYNTFAERLSKVINTI